MKREYRIIVDASRGEALTRAAQDGWDFEQAVKAERWGSTDELRVVCIMSRYVSEPENHG